MITLSQKLKEYSKEDTLSFHMPGHKERGLGEENGLYGIDITEIDGFDDLHHPEGVLYDEMHRAASLYGAKNAFLLVGGSTAGNIAGIFSCTMPRQTVLMARNCHKSIYNAVLLRELSPIYVNPKAGTIQGEVLPEDVEKAFQENDSIKLVAITSPTYDGVVSDVDAIAEICRAHGVPLLVDAAHGAHFEWSDKFPKSAVRAGADIVITSLHKTLPSMTSTALMLISGDIVDSERVKRYLGMFQTSSPSYVLLNSISECLNFLSDEKRREKAFIEHTKALDEFYLKAKSLKNIFVEKPCDDRDYSKVIIIPPQGITGVEIKDRLLAEYKIHLEMATISYAVALTSVCDKREQLDYLYNALRELDEAYSGCQKSRAAVEAKKLTYFPQKAMEPYEIESRKSCWVELAEAKGMICAQNVIPYPPGIPLLVTGEVIGEEAIQVLKEDIARKIRVEGLIDGRVCVVNS